MHPDIKMFWNVYETPFGFGAFASRGNGISSILLPDGKWTTDAKPDFPDYDPETCFFDSSLNGRSVLQAFFNEEMTSTTNPSLKQILDWDAFTAGKTDFQKSVLNACFAIPRGEILSYGCLAEKAGFPGSARAAGSVMATNPVPLLVPCHRVVRSDLSVGNYGGGSEMKRFLLEVEGSLTPV